MSSLEDAPTDVEAVAIVIEKVEEYGLAPLEAEQLVLAAPSMDSIGGLYIGLLLADESKPLSFLDRARRRFR